MKLPELCWCLCELLEPKLLCLGNLIAISLYPFISYACISFTLFCHEFRIIFGYSWAMYGNVYSWALRETVAKKAFGSNVGKSASVDSGSGLGLTLRSFDFFGSDSSLTDFTAIGRCVYITLYYLELLITLKMEMVLTHGKARGKISPLNSGLVLLALHCHLPAMEDLTVSQAGLLEQYSPASA